VGQDKIVIDLEQRQLIPQARFALAKRVDPPPDRGYTLTDVQVKSFDKRGTLNFSLFVGRQY
jgi:hypothetical protein